MGTASMVIGIVSLIIGLIPFCGAWAILPALVGLGLAIADVAIRSRRKQPRGMAIAGLPGVVIGATDQFAWTFTSGSSDTSDMYVEVLNPHDPGQYLFDGQWHDLDSKTGILQPAGKHIDDRAIALVKVAADAADRGGADQARNHGQQLGWILFHAIACRCPVSA